jgi:hypothetical protein
MPTYHSTARFLREFNRLTPAQRAMFLEAVRKFIQDLERGVYRKSLRIKRFQGAEGVWELTWAADGRALFEFGPPVRPGMPHIHWLRIGGHEIFQD